LCVDLVYNPEKSKTLAKLRERCAEYFGLDSERVESILEQLDRRALEMGRILDVGMPGTVDIESILQEAQREVLQETLRLLQNAIASELQAADLRSENARLLRSAQTDPLTGLANRSTLFDALGSCVRHGEPAAKRNSLALILADVDHFKSINDTFGHSVGDRALRLIAQAIIDVTREGDLAARFGGDEFVVALPKATEPVLAQVGERIRAAVEKLVLPTASGPARITLSIGGVVCEDLDSSTMIDELIEAADSRMYEAKQRGGNQCRFGLGRTGDVAALRHRR
jgi:diguanylate cyclase (GGDEF)-like protein